MNCKQNSLLPLKVNGLTYKKVKKTLLNKVSCTVETNGITIVMGPNGAGKTIFLRCLHGLNKVNNNTIKYSNTNLNEKIRLHQAMVFQTPILLRRTVLQNILFVINQRKIKIHKNKIFDLLSKVDLSHVINQSANHLSGGEKQRLSLARALVTSPKILFLDEATSNLDPYSVQIIENIIKEFSNKGTKVIAITHDLLQAKRLASDIVFFHKGNILEHSSSKDFFMKPKSKEGKLFIEGKIVV